MAQEKNLSLSLDKLGLCWWHAELNDERICWTGGNRLSSGQYRIRMSLPIDVIPDDSNYVESRKQIRTNVDEIDSNIVSRLPDYYLKLGIDNREGGKIFLGHAHNQFLQILVGSGVVGFIAWTCVFVFGGLYFYRRFKTPSSPLNAKVGFAALVVILTFLANCLVESPFMLTYARGFLFMLVGFSAGYLINAERTKGKA